MSDCLPCAAGFHGECDLPQDLEGTDEFKQCCCRLTHNFSIALPGKLKANEDIKDQTSTGRKRAALLYPIPSVEAGGMNCEWAGLAFAGGGNSPIIGCRGSRIADTKEAVDDFWPGNVHHGPDKSTLNNEPGNVHRICPNCHNRWHALNDPYYGVRPESGAAFLPLSGEVKQHDKETKATQQELEWSEKYWAIPTRKRVGVPYRLPGMREENE